MQVTCALKTKILFILVIAAISVRSQSSAPLLVGDTCTSIYTSYRKISDSVYKVDHYMFGVHIFDGFFRRPEKFEMLYFNEVNEEVYFRGKPDSLCITRNPKDEVTEWVRYQDGKLQEKKRYYKQKMVYHFYVRNQTEYSITYSEGKIKKFEEYNPKNHTLLSTYDNRTFIYHTGRGRNECLSIEGDKTVTVNGTSKVITYYYPNTFKERKIEEIKNDRLIFQVDYDTIRRPISELHYTPNGQLDYGVNYTYKQDSSETSISKQFNYGKYSKVIDPETNINRDSLGGLFKQSQRITGTNYKLNTKTDVMEYIRDNEYYHLEAKGDHTSIDYSEKKSGAPLELKCKLYVPNHPGFSNKYKDTEDEGINSYLYSIQISEDTEVHSYIKNYYSFDYLPSLVNRIQPNIYSSLNNFKDVVIRTESFIQNIKNQLNFETYINARTDSIFSKGQLAYVRIQDGNNLSLIEYNAGKGSIVFQTDFLRIAKDQEKCNFGLKLKDSSWLNDLRYEKIFTMYTGGKNKLYIGYNSGFSSIYDWSGQLLSGPIFGIKINDIESWNHQFYKYYPLPGHMSDSSTDYQFMFLLDNERDSIYGFISPGGKILYSSPYRIRTDKSTSSGKGWYLEDGEKVGFANFHGLFIRPVYKRLGLTRYGNFIATDSMGTFLLDSAGKPLFYQRYRYSELSYPYIIFYTIKTEYTIYDLRKNEIALELKDVILSKQAFGYLMHQNNTIYQITDRLTLKRGLLNISNMKKITNLYDTIFFMNNSFIGKAGISYDFYDTGLNRINSVKADSIYFSIYDIGFPGIGIFNEKRRTKMHINGILVSYKGKFGMIDRSGKTLIPATYDYLGIDNYEYYFGISKKDTVIYNKDFKLQKFAETFPRNSHTEIIDIKKRSGLMVLNWKGKPLEIQPDELNQLNLNIYSLKKNGLIIGFMNQKGELKKLDIPVSSVISDNDHYYFNHRGQSCIMDCKFNLLYKTDYSLTSELLQDRYLWVSREYETDKKRPSNSWKIIDIRTGRISKDSFSKPTPLNRDFSLVTQAGGQIGILDSNLNLYRTCAYDKYLDDYMDDKFFFMKKDSGIDLFTQHFEYLRTFDYEYLVTVAQGYLGFKNDWSYLLDKNFSVKDSSDCMFSNDEILLFQKNSPDLNDQYSIYTNRHNNSRITDTQLNDWKTRIPDPAYNFYKVLSALRTDKLNSSVNIPMVHLMNAKGRTWTDGTAYDYAWYVDGIRRDVSDGYLYVNYVDFSPYHDDYFIEGYKGKFCSYSKGSGTSGNKDREILNYCFTDNGAYQITLKNLIDPDLDTEFEKFLIEKTNEVDDPQAPCLKKTDLLETYSDRFVFGMDGILIFINDQYSIHIYYQDLKAYMKQRYADMLGN